MEPSDLLTHLKNAIRNLEAFAEQNELEPVPHIQDLDLKEDILVSSPHSTLEKTIDLISSLLPEIRQKHDEKRSQIKKKILESIEFLRTHYRMISKLKKGDPEQQALASWAINTISRYNTLVNKATEVPYSLKNRVIRFIYEQSGLSLNGELKKQIIHLPHEFSVHFSTAKKDGVSPPQEQTKKKVALFLRHTEIISYPPTEQEKEMFHMKTIILAKKLPQNLMNELMHIMKNVPIKTEVSSPVDNGEGKTSIVSLEKTISLLPWEVTKVKGAFKRDARSRVPSEPIKDSFEATTTAVQTGFPHPSQHTGWALSNVLIPDCPYFLDQMPLFHGVYEKKKQISAALLPQGELNEKAKYLWNLKRRAFHEKQDIYLDLNYKLSRAIAQNSSYSPLEPERIMEIIDHFYDTLKQHPSGFEALSQTYQFINLFFIERPYEYLIQEWLELHHPDLSQSQDPKIRHNAALALLDKKIATSINELTQEIQNATSLLERTMEEYILHIGYLIGQGCRAIILQQMSEKIGFPPSPLSEFDHKLQIVAFRQLLEFNEELNLDLNIRQENIINELQQRLKQTLLAEIQLFQILEIPQDRSTEITLELERYYNTQFFHNQ